MAEASGDAAALIAAREKLLRSLRQEIKDERVLAAFAKVPREHFVPPEAIALAYEDRPLAIGHGQTISQPRMVAIMLQELRLKGTEKVLEVGTGSGYQTALLAELASSVVSVEIIPELALGARNVLAALDCHSVRVEIAGRELGWPAGGPYNAIIVAAAAPRLPLSLVEQLAPGGRLVLPVGGREQQDLMLAEALPDGITLRRKGACRFVPLIGREAYTASVRS